MRTAAAPGADCRILSAVEEVNAHRRACWPRKIAARLGDRLKGRRIALWGLAFKPNTDDMREAPSRVLIEDLLCARCLGVRLRPGGDARGAAPLRQRSRGCPSPPRPSRRSQEPTRLRSSPSGRNSAARISTLIRARLKTPAIFDGRNLYEPAEVRRHGLEYHAIGRPERPSVNKGSRSGVKRAHCALDATRTRCTRPRRGCWWSAT